MTTKDFEIEQAFKKERLRYERKILRIENDIFWVMFAVVLLCIATI